MMNSSTYNSKLAKFHLLAVLCTALSLFLPILASAEDPYPNKPLRWIVSFPAGGAADFLARTMAAQMGKQMSQSIIVENRPGAAGIIGTEVASKAAPDGYTLLTGDNGAMVFHSAMYKKLPYDPKDFTPVGFMAHFPLILVVNPQAPFQNAKDWLAMVKQNPGKFSYASPGTGSPHHMGMELLKDRTKTAIVHIPYRGTVPAIQDVISGQVPMMIVDTAGGMAQIRAGKVKPLAVLSHKRIASLPDVPTIEELGVKDFQVTGWQALFVPKGTPEPIVKKLSQEMIAALNQPEVKARLTDFGVEPAPSDGPTLAKFIETETKLWHSLIKERRLSAE
jgi:tripartite-type tricarboxylate transporter receptor subunit TctC